MCFSCICLFALYVLVFAIFSSSWCRGLAAVCDCDTPWTFLLTFLAVVVQIILILAFLYIYTWDRLGGVGILDLGTYYPLPYPG